MRPHGEVRVAVAAALLDGPATTVDLAVRTGWSIGRVRTVLMDMVRAGDAAVVASVRRAGVKRPVPVYGRAERVEPVRCEVPDLVAVWAGLARPAAPVGLRMGVAM